MAHDVAIVVTSRLGSKRIPRKPFADIAGRRAFEWQLEFLKRSGYPIIAAIPAGSEDDPLAKAYTDHGVEVLRGHDDDPLRRLLWATDHLGAAHVVRVTSDDILLDADLLREQVAEHLRTGAGYTYCPAAPQGTTAEVLSHQAICAAIESAPGGVTEHLAYAFKESGVRVHAYIPHPQYRHPFRLVMDWPEDLLLLRIVLGAVGRSYGSGCTLSDVIQYLRAAQNAHIPQINAQPQVTVYSSCYNAEAYVQSAMSSVVCGQEGARWEYLVYDDGSTDRTTARIMEYYSGLPDDLRRRVQVFRHGNIGLPATCNLAIARARGKYLIRLDADDIMEPGALASLYGTMKTLNDAAALFSGYRVINEFGGEIGEDTANAEEHPGMCMLLTRAAHDVRYRAGLEHYEGREFMQRFKQRYRVAHTDQITWRYRKHGASKSAVQTPEREAVRQRLGIDS